MPRLGAVGAAVSLLLAAGGVASAFVAPETGVAAALALGVCVALGALVLAVANRAADIEREVAARTRTLVAEVEARRAVEALLRDSESRLLEAQRLARLSYWEWHPNRDELALSSPLREALVPGEFYRLDDLLAAADPRDRAQLQVAHEAALEAGAARCDFRGVRANGHEPLWLAATLTAARGVVRGAALDVTEHKLAELAARDGRARLDVALGSARMGTWEFHVAAKRFDFDEREEGLFGFAPGEFDGTPAMIARRVHPDDLQGLRDSLRQAVERGTIYQREFRVLVPGEAEPRWLQGYGRLLADAARPGRVIGVNIDITERKRAEQRLRAGEARLAEAQAIARLGSFDKDLLSGAAWWSDELYRLLGYAPGEVEPTRAALMARVDPADRATLEAHLEAAAAGLARPRTEFRTLIPGSAARVLAVEAVVDSDSGVPRRRGTIQDVTERRESEARLRASESRLAEAQRAARLGGWDYDPARGELAPTAAAAQLLGLPARPRPLSDFLDRVPADDRRAVEAALADAARGAPRVECEHRYAHPDGPRHLVLRAAGSESGAVSVSSQDITERKAAADERARIDARLQQTQKLESLGVLAGGVAHDFNNLLTGILGHANLARETLEPDSPLHAYLKPIEKAAEKAAQLCKQMLTYAGKGETVRGPLDLNRVVAESGELLRLALPKGARFDWRLADGPLNLVGDAGQLRQVVLNLVQNAAEALPPGGGAVTIATGHAPDGRIYLDVRDTGPGLDAAAAARVFEPFYTTKFPGRGLGLSAVHGIVRGHGGDIELDSAPGEGARFRLLLTAAAPRAALVADDEALVRGLARAALGRAGFCAAEADGGAAAIELFRADPGRYAVALIDLAMPGVSGRELLAAIRAERPDLPVIVMSGCCDEELREATRGEHLYALRKPFRAPDLAACLGRAVAGG